VSADVQFNPAVAILQPLSRRPGLGFEISSSKGISMRRTSRWITIIVAMLVSVAASQARALRIAIYPLDSVEWIVADSDLVVRCRPTTIDRQEDYPDQVTLVVSETYKGTPVKALTVWNNIGDIKGWIVSGEERILFLVRTGRLGSEASGNTRGVRYPFAVRDERMLRYSSPMPLGVTSDLRVLKTLEQLEAAVRAAVAFTGPPLNSQGPDRLGDDRGGTVFGYPIPPSGAHSIVFNVDFAKQAGFQIYTSELRVPSDARIEAIAHGWHNNGQSATAAQVLQHFKNPTNVEIFKELLHDPISAPAGGTGLDMRWRYPVRDLAVQTLMRWGVHVPPAEVDMPRDGYRPLAGAVKTVAIVSVIIAAMFALLLAIYRSRHARRMKASGASLLARLPLAGWDALCVVLLAMGVMAVVAVVRASVVYECTLPFRDGQVWAYLYRGKLSLAQADGSTTVQAASYATFDAKHSPSERWTEPPSGAQIDRDWPGLKLISSPNLIRANWGSMKPVAGSGAYRSITVPGWLLPAALLLIPVARLIQKIRGVRRRRRRRRMQQCLDCGYDLRSGHERCPECGAATALAAMPGTS
jgi:hypothetical protein